MPSSNKSNEAEKFLFILFRVQVGKEKAHTGCNYELHGMKLGVNKFARMVLVKTQAFSIVKSRVWK